MQQKFILLVLILMATACTDSTPRQSLKPLQYLEGSAQGTTYHLSFWSTEAPDLSRLQQAIAAELEHIDAMMSNYRQDSVIERFNANETTTAQEVGSDIVALVERARSVTQASGGCYDLTIKPLFDLWGFTRDQFSLVAPEKVHEALATIGLDKLESAAGTQLRKTLSNLKVDLSSIAQGYSVGRIADVLERSGIHDYLVEIGGELLTKGRKPGGQAWRVAIEKPLPEQRSLQKVITMNSGNPMAMMSSGTYRHYFDSEGVRYSHILDARTGFPVSHATVSVTVLYADPTLADAWSTALLCLGRESGVKLANETGIPALFIEQKPDGLHETFSQPLLELQGVLIE